MTVLSPATRINSILTLTFALALAAAAGLTPLAAQELPPAIQADRLLLQVESQIQDQDYGAALATLNRILDLQAAHDLEIPVVFWFKRAQVAMEADSVEMARTSAIKYLEATGQGGEHYMATLELLNAADTRLAEAEELREEAERLRAEADSQRVEDERYRGEVLRQVESTSPGRVFRDCEMCPVMAEVPAGSFTIGTPASVKDTAGSYYFTDRDQEMVRIQRSFAVGVYEVTFADWDACVSGGGCGGYRPDDQGFGRGRHPVINVSWEDAQRYVRWLSLETGQPYRLLTEEEWEYVARAGTQTLRYWGDGDAEQCQHANGLDQTFVQSDWGRAWLEQNDYEDPVSCSDGHTETAPVGSFPPNPFGLYDMMGNVGEWTATRYDDRNYNWRYLRGGSWLDGSDFIRSARRDGWTPSTRYYKFGLRVARTLN